MAGADGASSTKDRSRPRSRKRRIAVWGARALAALILLPIALVAALVLRVWFGQPELDGERLAPGLLERVVITRDAKGVVHIEAENELDLYFALGFTHAQDRFFQMEAMRRIAAGRLAEIVGPPALGFDIRMRTLGVAHLAAGDVAALSPEALAAYRAYADGVNGWLKTRSGVAADELALLLAPEPEPWLPEHSLAWNRLMSLRLVGNWASELMRLRLARVLAPERLRDLWPDYPPDGPVSFPSVDRPALDAAAAYAKLSDPDDGSNGWAIAAERSSSGAALLGNDPHLGLTTPGTWHLVSLSAPGLRLAGATAPGVPNVVLGHNGVIAWGLTNATTDTSDIFVERIDPADAARYLTPIGSRPFETRTETIEVRFASDRKLEVRRSRHGPILSDQSGDAPTGAALALAHTGLLEREGSAETLFRVNRARSWADIRAAMKHTNGPQQNAIYAGPDGIALATVGKMPVRRRANGYMPADGSKTDGDWVALAGAEAMPQSFRPARGWAANANNKLAGDDFPIKLGREWGYPGRIARIEAVLAGGGPFDLDAMQALQYDNHSPIFRKLGPVMLSMIAKGGLSDDALTLIDRLSGWDGVARAEAPEPLIFFAWMREAIRAVFQDELGEAFEGWFSLRTEPFQLALSQRRVWCDDVRTEPVERCGDVLATALENAHAWLSDAYGREPANWRWDDAHRAQFRHMGFGFVPGLNRLFNVEQPAPGAQETVNRAAFSIRDPRAPFVQRHGPGLRALYDLADLERSRFVIGPGQSGRLFSPNRSDMAADWRDGRYVSLTAPTEPRHVLTLKPAAAR